MKSPLLSVLVPVYNERPTLEALLRRVLAVPVDDGGAGRRRRLDATAPASCCATLAGRLPIRAFYHARNRGKGRAIRTALAEARGEIVIIQDGDLEYDPSRVPAADRADPCAARPRSSTVRAIGIIATILSRSPISRSAVLLLTATANLLYGTRLTDEATCYKVFRASLLRVAAAALRALRVLPRGHGPRRQARRARSSRSRSATATAPAAGQEDRLARRLRGVLTLLRYRFSD